MEDNFSHDLCMLHPDSLAHKFNLSYTDDLNESELLSSNFTYGIPRGI